MIFVFYAYFAVLLIAVAALIRNQCVLRERLRIIDKIHELNKADSQYDGWRYKAFDEISYDQMFYQFWRPVRSFYKNHRCLT
jgi:hypothetical protein